jgi:hypothetical protein
VNLAGPGEPVGSAVSPDFTPRIFHPGRMMLDLKREHAEASEGTLKSFAIVAVPVAPSKTGNRGFCGDSTGRICTTSDGSAPPVQDGLCPSGCMELE